MVFFIMRTIYSKISAQSYEKNSYLCTKFSIIFSAIIYCYAANKEYHKILHWP